mgnify:CR=1 FL=1
MAVRAMRERETGQRKLGSDPLAAAARQLRAASLDLSTHFEFATVHNQAVTALGLEGVEGRYLLSAAADATSLSGRGKAHFPSPGGERGTLSRS